MNMHLGYVYEQDHKIVNPAEFVPAYRPGARLSHAWIRTLRPEILPSRINPVDLSYLGNDMAPYSHRDWKYSTLDLVPIDSFVLFHSSSGVDQAQSAEKSLIEKGVAVRRLEVGADFDFTQVDEDIIAGKKWVESYGLDQGNVLLVRPDQHVVAICRSADDLGATVSKVLDMRL
jgi:hypothetical protein